MYDWLWHNSACAMVVDVENLLQRVWRVSTVHEIMHLAIRALLIIATAVLFTVLVIKRPGGKTSYSKTKIVSLLVLGAIIGVVFWTTQSIYVKPPTA